MKMLRALLLRLALKIVQTELTMMVISLPTVTMMNVGVRVHAPLDIHSFRMPEPLVKKSIGHLGLQCQPRESIINEPSIFIILKGDYGSQQVQTASTNVLGRWITFSIRIITPPLGIGPKCITEAMLAIKGGTRVAKAT